MSVCIGLVKISYSQVNTNGCPHAALEVIRYIIYSTLSFHVMHTGGADITV